MSMVLHGVDPNEPIERYSWAKAHQNYRLEGYQLSPFGLTIWTRREVLRAFLEKRGCSPNKPAILPLVIDAMINSRYDAERKKAYADFAIDLVRCGADLGVVSTVSFFDAARRERLYDFNRFRLDIYPRNSEKTCSEIIAELACHDVEFARLLGFC